MSAKNDGNLEMSASVLSARVAAEAVVTREEGRSRSRMLAYENVARSIGRGPSWLRDLVAGKLKSIDGEVKRRLDTLLIQQLEAEIARLTHDLEMARRCGDHPASQHVCAIETHLRAAKALMNGEGQ